MTDAAWALDATVGQRQRSRRTRLALTGLLAALSFSAAVPQAPHPDEVVWDRMFRLTDGRLFVTDGAMVLDAALAKPRKLPGVELSASTGQVMERHMAAELQDEFALRELERGTAPQTYEAPSGVTFAAKYVDFLRSAVPGASLRMKGDIEPVVIMEDGNAVGLLMALRRREASTP